MLGGNIVVILNTFAMNIHNTKCTSSDTQGELYQTFGCVDDLHDISLVYKEGDVVSDV